MRELNAAGMSASLDYLGEDVLERRAATETVDTYLQILDALAESAVDSNVSVKLTAMGLLVDEDFALENLLRIVERAKRNPDPFVRIDMEGSPVTQPTLRVFERAFAQQPNVGIVLQAYLKRTADDVERAIALGARVRLCKGAYSEPAGDRLSRHAGDSRAFHAARRRTVGARDDIPALRRTIAGSSPA